MSDQTSEARALMRNFAGVKPDAAVVAAAVDHLLQDFEQLKTENTAVTVSIRNEEPDPGDQTVAFSTSGAATTVTAYAIFSARKERWSIKVVGGQINPRSLDSLLKLDRATQRFVGVAEETYFGRVPGTPAQPRPAVAVITEALLEILSDATKPAAL